MSKDTDMIKKWVLVAQSGPILFNPMDYSPLPMEFSRPEYWSG